MANPIYSHISAWTYRLYTKAKKGLPRTEVAKGKG